MKPGQKIQLDALTNAQLNKNAINILKYLIFSTTFGKMFCVSFMCRKMLVLEAIKILVAT